VAVLTIGEDVHAALPRSDAHGAALGNLPLRPVPEISQTPSQSETTMPEVNSKPSPDRPILASDILQRLHDEAQTDQFTLAWLMDRLHKRSFGVIILLCAVVAVAPGVSIVAGVLIMIAAVQMIAGRPAPVFPTSIAARPLPTRHLAALLQRALPVLRYLEQVAHPRWRTPHEATRRIVGIAVLALSVAVVFTPIPLSNIPPALVIALISLAYLEEDGLLLAIGLLLAVILLTVESVAAWGTILGAKRLIGLW
jgi:hypothetical protein